METQSSTDRIQHTAGPWTDEVTDEGTLIVRAANGDTVVYMGDMETTEGEDHANARLIAAAPELRQTTGELHRLLREWRRTPFFEDTAEWQRWVDDFGARVDQATDVAVTVLRKVAEVQP